MTITAERARHIHDAHVVIDSMSGAEVLPVHFTPSILQGLRDRMGSGIEQLMPALRELFDEALLGNELPEYWEFVEAGGVDAVNVTVGIEGTDMWSAENAIRDIGRWQRLCERVPRFLNVTSARDIEQAAKETRRGIMLGFQNCQAIGDDLGMLKVFRDLGIVVIQLTYNQRNLLGDGCMESANAGLSQFGVNVVRHMNELGILVDLSHCGEQTTLDAIAMSERPVAITHSTARAVHDHARAKSDAVLEAIARHDGYFGVAIVPSFLTGGSEASLADWLHHFRHVVEVAGPANVGIGTDHHGYATVPRELLEAAQTMLVKRMGFSPEQMGDLDWAASVEGYESYRDWPNLTACLLDAGFSDDEVSGFVGANYLRVFEKAVG